MSTNVNPNILKNFIVKTLGVDHLTKNEAKKHDIDADKYDEANVDENNYLEIDEIINDNDLYEQFAVMYVQEQEKKTEAKDKEKEKEDQTRVTDKSEAKA